MNARILAAGLVLAASATLFVAGTASATDTGTTTVSVIVLPAPVVTTYVFEGVTYIDSL